MLGQWALSCFCHSHQAAPTHLSLEWASVEQGSVWLAKVATVRASANTSEPRKSLTFTSICVFTQVALH